MVTQTLIDELISCQKRIEKADRQKMFPENRHFKNTYLLTSLDEKYKFKAFLRLSLEFIEDFSVGLIWTNPNEHINVKRQIILLRCQGPHDSGKPIGQDIHHDYHTHEITVDDILESRYTKPLHKNTSDKFTSFDTAVFYFLSRCGIINYGNYTDFHKYKDQLEGQTSIYD